jgi:hypothetical protein
MSKNESEAWDNATLTAKVKELEAKLEAKFKKSEK